MKPYGLPNRIVSELSAKILESPKLLNYIYYTDIENQHNYITLKTSFPYLI